MERRTNKPAAKRVPWARLAAICFWLLVWELGARWLHRPLFLPTVSAVGISLVRKVGDLVFWQTLTASLFRMLSGFLLGAGGGILLAVLAAWRASLETLLAPLMAAIRSVPAASFVVLALFWLSERWLSVFIAFLLVLPIVYANTLQGFRQVDTRLLEVADVFAVPTLRRLRGIWLPAVFPYWAAAGELGLGLCWKAGVSAEMIGQVRHSIGKAIYESKIYLESDELFSWTIALLIASWLMSHCLRAAAHRLAQRVLQL